MTRTAMCLLGVLLVGDGGCQQSSNSGSTSSSTTTTSASASSPAPAASNPEPSTEAGGQASGAEVTLPNGLKYVDVKVGDGGLAESGMSIQVHYTGWLLNGTKFDSSLDHGQPFTFKLGAGEVIRGWDEGVKGMRVGGKRKLTIPPDLGYGAQANGAIPANSTLVFDVELLAVR